METNEFWGGQDLGNVGNVSINRVFPKLIAARASFDATCRLWDATSGHCLRIFADNKKPVFTLSFSTDGAILATGGGDGLFQLYDVDVSRRSLVNPSFHL
jgi:WD40 repeat protein